jgi:hypothetical protein
MKSPKKHRMSLEALNIKRKHGKERTENFSISSDMLKKETFLTHYDPLESL